jgi:ankyrin repeat protein
MVDNFSPLMTAARYGLDIVTNLLLRKREPRVNTRNANGLCALWYGVEKGSFAVVNQLLEHPRVKIDLPNCQGQTVL